MAVRAISILMNIRPLFYFQEYKSLLRLGVPIIIGQVGMTVQGVADTIMVGRHSTGELAAAGFVNNLFTLAILLCIGYSMGAVSQIGSCYTQGRRREIVTILKSSFVADLSQSLFIVLCLLGVYFALPWLGQPEELLPLMRPYFLILLVSLPVIMACSAFRQFFDCLNDTWVSMLIMLIGNIWNIVFNWFLIFGKCGFPELGIDGAAWATLTSRLAMLVLYVLIFFFAPRYVEFRHYWRTERHKKREVALLNRLGWPIAIQMGMETASFSLCAIMLGWVGTAALAAHQVMLNVSMMIFMFYIGVGSAVAIRVSNYKGLDNYAGVRTAAHAGYHIIFVLGVIASITVFCLRQDISALFTDSDEVAAIVTTLVWPLVLYQLGDGIQTNYVNALRGLGDVKRLVYYSFVAYVIISLPLSYLFGIALEWGAFGIWMGFPFGLTSAGVLYVLRFRKISRHSSVAA